MDLVLRRPAGAHRGRVLNDLAAWLEGLFGQAPRDLERFRRALTHSSVGADSYERLEFLGDRVLGFCIAEWLFALFPDEPEGQLSKRLNALVAGATCAEIAREIGVPGRVILGKQARDDGAGDSDYVLGDVVESLLGALFLEAGLEPARAFVRRAWATRVGHRDEVPQHPKSQLQEWAAANRRRTPAYELVERSGPEHAPRFTVKVAVGTLAEAQATGATKQEAETEAARVLLAQVQGMAKVRRRKRV